MLKVCLIFLVDCQRDSNIGFLIKQQVRLISNLKAQYLILSFMPKRNLETESSEGLELKFCHFVDLCMLCGCSYIIRDDRYIWRRLKIRTIEFLFNNDKHKLIRRQLSKTKCLIKN